MADVFLSYKRDERAAVETIASSLRDLGLTVWFDAGMSAGETFNAEIDREARAAKAVLVCWSPAARQSEWVNAEAMIGFEQKKLAACYVSGPDLFSAPTPFNATHAEDLRAWLTAPSVTHSAWKSVLRRLGKLCRRSDIESYGALNAHASASDLRRWIGEYNSSPLLVHVDRLLKGREAEEADQARIEMEVRERRQREALNRAAQEEADRLAQNEQARLERVQKEEADARKQTWHRCWHEAIQIVALERKAFASQHAKGASWLYWASALGGLPIVLLGGNPIVLLLYLVAILPMAWFIDRGERDGQARAVYADDVVRNVAERIYRGEEYNSYLRSILQKNAPSVENIEA